MTVREKRLELHAYQAHNRRIALIDARFRDLWAAAYEKHKKENAREQDGS